MRAMQPAMQALPSPKQMKAPKASAKKYPAKPPNTVPKRMRELKAQDRAAIDAFLISEVPIEKVVDAIQNEMGLWQDMKFTAVRQMLFRYRSRFIAPKQAEIVAKVTGDKGAVQLAALSQQLQRTIDPLIEMEKLISHQMDRINKLHQLEGKMPSLLDQQTKNVNLLSEMLNKFALLKMEIGEIKRLPKKLTIQAFDVTEEERQFIERAKVNESTASFLTEAMMFLRDEGVIDVDSTPVEEDGTESRTESP